MMNIQKKIEILFQIFIKYSEPTIMASSAIVRMTDDNEFEREFGTPRPGGQREENKSFITREEFRIRFAQAADARAAAIKRRRSPTSRTYYNISLSVQVKRALENLEKENDKFPERRLPNADIGLLARAIQNCRVRLIVHDRQSRDDLKQQYTQAQKDEVEAEEEMKKSMSSSTTDVDGYLRAKDRHQDAKIWRMDISNELTRTESKYNKQTGEIDNAGVPSQHAQIPEAAGVLLRNILSPETIRRRFISLDTLTKQIGKDVAAFLSDESRHKDRMEVICQIKESKKKN
jgi:hypothetical protein